MKIKADGSAGIEMKHLDVKLERKSITDAGEFEGYGSVFGVRDSYGDVVMPGAFKDSLAEHAASGTMPALLYQHNPDDPIGVYTEMREDTRGLYVKGTLLLETQRGRDVHAMLKAGALNGLSIGYMPKRWLRDEENDVLQLLEVELWECSVVTFPANGAARVSGVKAKDRISGLASWQSYETFLRDEGGFSKEAAAGMAAAARRIRDAERDALAAKATIKAGMDRLNCILNT